MLKKFLAFCLLLSGAFFITACTDEVKPEIEITSWVSRSDGISFKYKADFDCELTFLIINSTTSMIVYNNDSIHATTNETEFSQNLDSGESYTLKIIFEKMTIYDEDFTLSIEDSNPPVVEVLGELVFPLGTEITKATIIPFIKITDDIDGDITPTEEMIDLNGLNSNEPGTYTVIVTVSDARRNETVEEISVVISPYDDVSKPQITLLSEIVLECYSVYDLKTFFSVVDNVDGFIPITDAMIDSSELKITILGTYGITFTVSDKAGNTDTKTFEVRVVDTTDPVISYSGKTSFIIGEEIDIISYVTIIDNYDGEITVTASHIDTSAINSERAGEYLVVCSHTDSSGNIGSLTFYISLSNANAVHDIDERLADRDDSYMPSVGQVDVLIIPVNITKSANPGNGSIDKIRTGFFGTSAATNWESVSTYYQKSSYGKLNIGGTITSWYTPKQNQNYYASQSDGSQILLYEALDHFNDQYDYSNYDSNDDGIIDAVYLIYNCPIGGSGSSTQEEFYWAFVTWTDLKKKHDGVSAYSHMLAGVDFFDEKFSNTNENGINAETFIHETGHLLGLDDYYDYDDRVGLDGGYGGADMMDWNVGDHNPFSKSMLGWVNPFIVEKTSTITLRSFTVTGDYIMVPISNDKSIFTEYFVIDFYTIHGLNVKSMPGYLNTDRIAIGVRISHVNATWSDAYEYFEYTSMDANSKYKQIRLLEADARWNGSKYTFDCDSNSNSAELSDFFTLNGTNSTSVLANYKLYTNTSKKLPFAFTITHMSDTEVTLDFQVL